MKIETESQSLLVLKQSTILAYVVGIIFCGLGLSMIVFPSMWGGPTDWWIGPLLFLVGLIPIAIYQSTTITLDRSKNNLTIFKKGLIKKGIENECSLDNIEAIEYRETFETDSDNKTTRYVNVFALLKDGEDIRLARYNPASGLIPTLISGSRPERVKIKKIAEFLNVEFREVRPPSIGETLSAIKEGIEKRL